MNARKRRTSNAGLHLVVGLLQEIRRRRRSEDGFDDLTEYRDLIDEDESLRVLVSTLLERKGPGLGDEDIVEHPEVNIGRDLQFIRINGTLVGGLIGGIIYLVTHFAAL